MNKFFYSFILTLLVLNVNSVICLGHGEDLCFALYDEHSRFLCNLSYNLTIGDQYITARNRCYEVYKIDYIFSKAWAREIYTIPFKIQENLQIPAFVDSEPSDYTVGIYHTHNDESYIEGDGKSSISPSGGIEDIGDILATNLEKNGFTVLYSKKNHLPHDSWSYQRSRRTAMSMIRKSADILIDVHRDGISGKYYTTTIKGKKVAKIRLVLGTQNPNQRANREFINQIKSIMDKKYPGLLKDIYLGKGNFNQDLSSRSVLIEVGTHETNKKYAVRAINLFSNVLTDYLNGGYFEANNGFGSAILYLLAGFIIIMLIYFLFTNNHTNNKGSMVDRTRKRYASAIMKVKKKDKKPNKK